MPNDEIKKLFFTGTLIKWHQQFNISYPWRGTDDPYKILLAEILLRKTTRKQVAKIYSLVVNKYPTISSLAEADKKELEKMLEPLGMQKKRSSVLIDIASEIQKKHSGKIPLLKDGLEKIRGVGPYTANAVLSMTLNQRLPMVDTNVVRVAMRVFGISSEKPRPRGDEQIWDFVQKLIPLENTKEFNLSLLDFANLICTARNPKCHECPVASVCAYKNG